MSLFSLRAITENKSTNFFVLFSFVNELFSFWKALYSQSFTNTKYEGSMLKDVMQ